MKTAYYGVSAISVLLLCLFFLGNLFYTGRPGEGWVEKAVLLTAGLTGSGIVAWSFAVGHLGGQWAMGIGLAVAGVVTFGVLMLGGLLVFSNGTWQ